MTADIICAFNLSISLVIYLDEKILLKLTITENVVQFVVLVLVSEN
jgi:hypothetical protein